MSFSYSGDPSNSVLDECRFLIGDTDENSMIMQDEEINYIIEKAGNNATQLHYMLFAQAATIFSRAIKRSLGPQSEDPTARLQYYASEAEFYKKRLSTSGISIPTFASPKIFHKGMHSNPPWPKPKGR